MVKTRQGFVSNSSSSSFIISRKYISDAQMEKIHNHREEGAKLKLDYAEDGWCISETDNIVEFSTYMDNFNMEEFLTEIGVDTSKIRGRDY